jgi:hypothetical protein
MLVVQSSKKLGNQTKKNGYLHPRIRCSSVNIPKKIIKNYPIDEKGFKFYNNQFSQQR